jgi:hypothetical protein
MGTSSLKLAMQLVMQCSIRQYSNTSASKN